MALVDPLLDTSPPVEEESCYKLRVDNSCSAGTPVDEWDSKLKENSAGKDEVAWHRFFPAEPEHRLASRQIGVVRLVFEKAAKKSVVQNGLPEWSERSAAIEQAPFGLSSSATRFPHRSFAPRLNHPNDLNFRGKDWFLQKYLLVEQFDSGAAMLRIRRRIRVRRQASKRSTRQAIWLEWVYYWAYSHLMKIRSPQEQTTSIDSTPRSPRLIWISGWLDSRASIADPVSTDCGPMVILLPSTSVAVSGRSRPAGLAWVFAVSNGISYIKD